MKTGFYYRHVIVSSLRQGFTALCERLSRGLLTEKQISTSTHAISGEEITPEKAKALPRKVTLWRRVNGVIAVVIIPALVASMVGCSKKTNTKTPGAANTETSASQPVHKKAALEPGFADYKEEPVNVSPAVPSYEVNADLSNVMNVKDFKFSAAARDMLVQNGFFLQEPSSNATYLYDEFFPIYEDNRYKLLPNFVTTDSILHNYHLLFNYLLGVIEQGELSAELRNLNKLMLADAKKQYDTVKGTEWENAAKRNIAFFAVAGKLHDADATLSTIKSDVDELTALRLEDELDLIGKHQGISSSPVMGMGAELSSGEPPVLPAYQEDYSQYIPRGHYEKSPVLKGYFKAMMWYGRMTFRFKSPDELRSAVLITLSLNNPETQKGWSRIYDPTSFFVGASDDITYYQLRDVVEKAYGTDVTVRSVLDDKEKFGTLRKLADRLEPPQINSMPVDPNADREQQIKGFRFMGQRFTIDASIFQRLIAREVPGRMIPKGLDIPAAMGSKEALNILDEMGETKYEKYSRNMNAMKNNIDKLNTKVWTQNLYWGWLYALRPLTEEVPDGYPAFMKNRAWERKQLNTYLGNWTELKHDTILYAKQVYAEAGGEDLGKKDDRGYVEPNPHLYGRIAALVAMTIDGLESRKLLTKQDKDTLTYMKELMVSLKTISEKELNNQPLSAAEYELIKGYGAQIEHIWKQAVNVDGGATGILDDNPAAVVADVTTAEGTVLEEGTGLVREIYAVVPVAGKLRIARGAAYSYYEFTWPASDRLTDSKWHQMLVNKKTSPVPSWSKSFTAKQ